MCIVKKILKKPKIARCVENLVNEGPLDLDILQGEYGYDIITLFMIVDVNMTKLLKSNEQSLNGEPHDYDINTLFAYILDKLKKKTIKLLVMITTTLMMKIKKMFLGFGTKILIIVI